MEVHSLISIGNEFINSRSLLKRIYLIIPKLFEQLKIYSSFSLIYLTDIA